MRSFLVDIDPNIELPEYNLVLYSLYEEPITELYNITNFNIKPFFIGIDEISFNIPMTRNEADGQIVRNEIYDMVDGEYYIKLNDSKFFIINKINEKTNDDGSTYKEVSAYSREAELNQKRLINYKVSSRMLYDRENTMLEDENGQLIERGILNYIFNHITKAWTVGTVDEKVVSLTNQGISRELDFSNLSLIQVFQELQKTYNCVFKFDTVNQVVNVESMLDYDINPNEVENSPQFKGLYISDENFIKNMSKNIEYDKVKTRLYLYGKDNISIQTETPVGLPYIDNFTTFKNTKFMTQELIDKLNEYDTLVANANPNFQPKRELLQQKHQELEGLYNADDKDDLNKKGLVALQRQLSLVQTEIDARVENLAIIKNTINSAEGIDLKDLYAEMKTVESEIDAFENQKVNIKLLITAKESQIETKNNEIKTVKAEIETIKDNLSVQANLAPHLVKELDKFIRVETYNDSNFTENNIKELYEEGKKNLAKISQPSIQFDVDVVDFLSIVECQHTWDKLALGDIVLLENKNIGFSYYVRLVGYEHSPDSNRLNLKFSNTNSFDDATLWIKDLLEQMSNTTSTLDFNKYKWDKTEDMQDRISKMVDEKLEEARQSILNAVGQRHLFDDSGLWLYKENPDGTLDDAQIRAINNNIVLTDDNFATVKTAISAKDGVNAEVIRGKLGQFTTVAADQVEVGGGANPPKLTDELDRIQREAEDKIDLINGEILDVDGKISGLENFTNTAFKDGILDMAEKESLLVHIQQLNNEKTDVDAKYTSIYEDVNLIGTPKDSLLTAKDNYNTSHGNLIIIINNTTSDGKITESEKTLINNSFTDYRVKLSALSTAFENAIRAIESKKSEKIANDLIVDFNTNVLIPTISGVQTQIDGKIETWNQDTDPSISWTTTAIKTKHAGDMWYNTTTKELKYYSGSSWILIEDKKAYEALGVANSKRTIFTSTPTPPYLVGDLWKVTGVAGIDFRVCMTANTIEYSASDWVDVNNSKTYVDTQKAELNTAITDLGTTITTAFSDGVITNIEAQSLKLTRDTLIREANDVRAIAVGLSLFVSTLDSSITALNTEVNKYVDKETYPISVTATARTNLNSAFTTVEGEIVTLYNSIESKKVTDLSGTLTGLIGDLQTQIDGKIDTWFYAVNPTLSNAPYNTWTSTALRDAHVDDLYYNTANGYVFKFTKTGTAYSWERIKDADIITAMTSASTAQATADGKMTVYISQPAPPYHMGDLWRPSANATDLKICTTARASGLYTAGDWSDATNVSGALSGLQGSINDFSSDLKLTLAEANGLKTSLESVTSESLELIATATALSITAEKTSYSNGLATLTNYLNTNWLGKTYPLTITAAQRTNVTNYFKQLENRKSILLTKIAEVRAIKEINDKAIVKGELYNSVKIDTESGLVATRTDNKARTTVNATDGIKIETKPNLDWESVFGVDLDGNLNIKGNITLTDGHINWENVNKFEVPAGYTDEDTINAIESTYIDENGVWTPNVYATNINTLNGKIQTAQIEDLVVGGNVTMGDSATIKWTNVDDKPTDLVTDGKLATELGKDYIITGKIKANQLMIGGANGVISFNDLDDKPSIPTKASDVGALPVGTFIPVVPSYIQSTKITSTSIESPTITAATLTGATIYGGEYYGLHSNSAYLKMGTVVGNPNFANLSIFRGKSTGQTLPVFRIYDQITIMDLQIGTGYSTPKTIMGSTGDNTYLYGNWSFNNATIDGLTISFA